VRSTPCMLGVMFPRGNLGGFIGSRTASLSNATRCQSLYAGVIGLPSRDTDEMKLTSGGASWSGQTLTEHSWVGGRAIG